jgi:cysteinyl-tRNA synthetase
VVSAPQVLKEFHPLALRWFLISTQYRSPINYSRKQLDQASDRLYYLYQVTTSFENCGLLGLSL